MIEARKRNGKQRKIKVAVISLILVGLACTSSFARWDRPVQGICENPSADELYSARNYYKLNGNNGDSPTFLERYAQYAPFIRGEVDSISDCEQ